jgi:hypothetical protein
LRHKRPLPEKKKVNKTINFLVCLLLTVNLPYANQTTLLPEPVLAALSQELSGETAKRNLEHIARHHRMRGSRGFRAAAEHIVEQLRAYGLSDARIEQFPADGKIFYGTQKSRPAWDAVFAELWEMRETAAGWRAYTRLASWDAMPVTLAQDSESGETTAELLDVGSGTSERDYAGKVYAAKSCWRRRSPVQWRVLPLNASEPQLSLVTHRTNAPLGGAKMKTLFVGDTSTPSRENLRLPS